MGQDQLAAALTADGADGVLEHHEQQGDEPHQRQLSHQVGHRLGQPITLAPLQELDQPVRGLQQQSSAAWRGCMRQPSSQKRRMHGVFISRGVLTHSKAVEQNKKKKRMAARTAYA